MHTCERQSCQNSGHDEVEAGLQAGLEETSLSLRVRSGSSQSANAHVIWSADYSRNSLFGWFVAGLVVYAILLIFATVAGKPGAA